MKYNKNIFNISRLMLVFLVVSLGGCGGSSNVRLDQPVEKLISNPNKAYVVFMRMDTFIGSAQSETIYEYLPKENNVKLVGTLSAGEKIVYPITQGKHFFYVNFSSKTMHVVDAKKGSTYYVNANLVNFTPVFYAENDKLQNKLQGMKCNEKNLNQYLFKESWYSGDDSDDSKIKYYESPALENKLGCLNSIATVEPTTFYGIDPTIKQLRKDTHVVMPSEASYEAFNADKQEIIDDVSAFYMNWKLKYEGIVLDKASIKIDKQLSESDYKKYDGVEFIKSSYRKQIDLEEAKVFSQQLQNSFSKGKNNVKVKLSFIKFFDGSRAGRWLNLDNFNPFTIKALASDKSAASVHLKIDVFNQQNQRITSFEIASNVRYGPFSGIESLEKDVKSLAKKYIEKNLLKS